MKKIITIPILLASFILTTSPVKAGVYSDELAKCVVKKTTARDKVNLIKWMFTVITLHPALKSLASVTTEERDKNNRVVAKMFENLLISSCKTEAGDAVRYEGNSAIESAFQVLGQVAARELFTNPAVSAGMADMAKYFDKKKFQEIGK